MIPTIKIYIHGQPGSARSYCEHTLQILQAGYYTNTHGERVLIREAQTACETQSVLYTDAMLATVHTAIQNTQTGNDHNPCLCHQVAGRTFYSAVPVALRWLMNLVWLLWRYTHESLILIILLAFNDR